MYSIEVNNLKKQFGKFTAVDEISFTVEEGQVLGFLGANGAGKSTTIRMLCGLLEPTSGDALVGGYSIKSQPDLVKSKIGYMSQRFSLYNDLTVEENIEFFGGVYGLEGDTLHERKKWALNVANLEGKEHLLTASLPGGIKQRLALSAAVIHNPSIVFLDEPTSGVDPVSRRSFWDLIHELADNGTTVLVTTHYLEEAEYCGNIILINAGKIIADGNPQKMKSDYMKSNIYKIECSEMQKVSEHLQTASFVDEVSVFGNYLHVVVNENLKDMNQLNRFLKEEVQTEIKRVEKVQPTIEDVFIYLLEKSNKQNELA